MASERQRRSQSCHQETVTRHVVDGGVPFGWISIGAFEKAIAQGRACGQSSMAVPQLGRLDRGAYVSGASEESAREVVNGGTPTRVSHQSSKGTTS